MIKTKAPTKLPVIRHMEFIPGGIHYFEMEASRRNIKHVQEVCVESGLVRCSCEHFTYNHAPHDPTLSTPQWHCKHVSAAIEWLLDNHYLDGEELELRTLLESLCPCVECSMPDAEMLLCDEHGRPTEGHLCKHCFEQLRAQNEQWGKGAQALRSQIAALETRRDELIAEMTALPDLHAPVAELVQVEQRLMGLWQSYLPMEAIR